MTPVFSGRTKLGICLPNLTTRGGKTYATSWHAPRSGGRRAPKGLIPFGNPQCVFVGAALSLRATRRKSLHLQRLRARLKERPHSLQSKSSYFLYLPLVVAKLGAQYRECICILSSFCLKSGNAREVPEGTSGFLFFRHFFVERQRNGILAGTASACRKFLVSMGRILLGKILRARANRTPHKTSLLCPRERQKKKSFEI